MAKRQTIAIDAMVYITVNSIINMNKWDQITGMGTGENSFTGIFPVTQNVAIFAA